jgi:hypothetical protein
MSQKRTIADLGLERVDKRCNARDRSQSSVLTRIQGLVATIFLRPFRSHLAHSESGHISKTTSKKRCLDQEIVHVLCYSDPVTFTMNKTGSYFLSKFKNSCATTFNPKKSERFKYSSNKVPGPGAYDLSQTNLASDGKYFPSKFRSSLVRSFPHSIRKTVSMNFLSNDIVIQLLDLAITNYPANLDTILRKTLSSTRINT